MPIYRAIFVSDRTKLGFVWVLLFLIGQFHRRCSGLAFSLFLSATGCLLSVPCRGSATLSGLNSLEKEHLLSFSLLVPESQAQALPSLFTRLQTKKGVVFFTPRKTLRAELRDENDGQLSTNTPSSSVSRKSAFGARDAPSAAALFLGWVCGAA